MKRLRTFGFTLIELMVTIAIIAVLMALAVPYFGTASKTSHERSVVAKFAQDFAWARGAAGAADASVLVAGAAVGRPVVTLTLNADCTWTTSVSGVTDSSHSMTPSTYSSISPNMTCVASVTLPVTFSFTAQGTVGTSATVTYTGASLQTYPLQILNSGLVIRESAGASSVS